MKSMKKLFLLLLFLGLPLISSAQQEFEYVPLFRHFNGQDHFYTSSAHESEEVQKFSYKYESIAAHLYNSKKPNSIDLYRMFSKTARDHFYTANFNEMEAAKRLGYQ